MSDYEACASWCLIKQLMNDPRLRVFFKDLELRYVYFTDSTLAYYGLTATDQLVGRTDQELFGEDQLLNVRQVESELLTRAEPILSQLEERPQEDGQTSFCLVSRWPWFDLTGYLMGIFTVEQVLEDWSALNLSRPTQEPTTHLDEQAMRAHRLESIGVLAGGIAHDLNNVLSPILMACDLLESGNGRQNELVDRIRTNAERGANLVKQVLTFARGSGGIKVDVKLRHIVADLGKVISETFPKNIVLHQIIDPHLRLISADPTQIYQVLLNLCINARDAMPQGGRLTVEARNFQLNALTRHLFPSVPEGGYVMLSVTDTGVGISPEVRKRMFDPFFSTKGSAGGSGLGLSTVFGIVESHRGAIEVNSEVGKGTCFMIIFPSLSTPPLKTTTLPKVSLPVGGGKRVLVVDDELDIRELSKACLEQAGYLVTTAKDGFEALDFFKKSRAGITLVITDMNMPNMDGVELIREILATEPSMKILSMSGDTNVANEGFTQAQMAFLPKPFRLDELVLKVDSLTRS